MTSTDSFEAFMTSRLAASTAFVNGDVEPLVALSASTSPATIFGPAGTAVEGADEINAANAAGARSFEPSARNEFDVLHQDSDDRLAYWVGVQRSTVRMHDQDEPVTLALRVTEVFRREDAGWVLVHRHADPLRS
ncbi:hypothetical protein BH10ACT10_BH10ACT10_29680 [soil metagenome]